MNIDYELVYKVRQKRLNTNSLANIEVGLVNKAKEEAKNIHSAYILFLKNNLPAGTQFEVSNVACMADGILNHVYTWQGNLVPQGVGKRKCCFCGCDDFDD